MGIPAFFWTDRLRLNTLTEGARPANKGYRSIDIADARSIITGLEAINSLMGKLPEAIPAICIQTQSPPIAKSEVTSKTEGMPLKLSSQSLESSKTGSISGRDSIPRRSLFNIPVSTEKNTIGEHIARFAFAEESTEEVMPSLKDAFLPESSPFPPWL